jgi:hypothetical protein
MVEFYSKFKIENSIVKGSRATLNSGALSIIDKGIVEIVNVTFEENSAAIGGTLYIINTP